MKMKNLRTLLAILIMAMSLLTPVYADSLITVSPDDLADLVERINELTTERDELQNQLENQPSATPAPVFAPNPRLLNPQNITLEPGETQDVVITLRNIGTHTAFNLLTQASSSGPFTVEFLNGSNNVNSLTEGRNTNMALRISVDEDAEPGSHTIQLAHSFRNQSRENATGQDTLTLRIGGAAAGAPSVRMGSFNTGGGRIEPGQTFFVSATIQNTGAAAARDVQVSLPNLSADTIFFTGDLNQASFDTMAGGYSGTLNFTFQTSSRIDTGTYEIQFRVTYRDANNNAQEAQTFSTFVNVYSSADTLANLEIRNMEAPTARLNVNQQGTINFYVYNTGETEARNIRVVATPEVAGHVVPVVTASTQVIPVLAPGASHRLSFSFSPRESAETRSYAIGFEVQFEDHSFEQFAALNVYNPERADDTEGNIQIPRIIVSAHTIYPRIPLAGQTFDMDITFKNTSATRSVNNIVITMEALEAVRDQGTVFTPHEGSNTMFIAYIPPGGEVTRSMSWFTVPDAAPRSYPVRVSFEYQDQDYREFSFHENLNINVQQIVRLEISDMHIPPTVMPGSSIWLDLQIINSGMVALRNLRVRVEGPFDASEANRFAGNVAAGAFRTYTGSIVPLEEGTLQGQFIVYGEDATGALVEFATDFTVEVGGGFGFDEGGRGEMDMMIGDEMFEGGGMIWEGDGRGFYDGRDFGFDEDGGAGILSFIRRPLVWGPVLAVAVLVIAIVVFIVSRNKNRLDFDDGI